MLFSCLWLNVDTSCHKHFVVVSRYQQTPPLTISDKCHNLPRSGGTVLITPSRSQRWQHAMKPDIGWDRDFCVPHLYLTTPLVGSRRNIVMTFGTEKLEWCGYPTVKNVQDVYFIRFDRIHKLCVKTVHQTWSGCCRSSVAVTRSGWST